MKTVEDVRSALLEFVNRDLVGPAHGEEEELDRSDDPKIRYTAGVLFPRESLVQESAGFGGIEDGDMGAEDLSSDSDECIQGDDPDRDVGSDTKATRALLESDYDDAIAMANSYRPSAMGMSFMMLKPARGLVIQVEAATYMLTEPEGDGESKEYARWRRRPLEIAPVVFDRFADGLSSADVDLADGLKLRINCRPRSDARYLVTTSVYNVTTAHGTNSKAFYQVGLSASTADGNGDFVEYTNLEGLVSRFEEISLAMLYRERRVFGVGHGCAVDWEVGPGGRATRVQTTSMPSVVVPSIVPRSGSQDCLSMEYLSKDGEESSKQIPAALRDFCAEYEDWIESKCSSIAELPVEYQEVARRHMGSCHTALNRMKSAVDFLETNELALDSFRLVNRAMLMQQHHSRLRRSLNDAWAPLPERNAYSSVWEEKTGYWRSFQLAFLLISLTSFSSERNVVEIGGTQTDVRDLVDLIWFPTGGGKTEAYLGVTAFLVFYSRLKGEDGKGCKVLMRYTLRLLTSQQFQRAATLMCACELIRREDKSGRLGDVPISIGLWVGKSLTPNDEKTALKQLTSLVRKKGEDKNPFQLLSCPWCGTELNNPQAWGYVEYRRRVVYRCPSDQRSDGACPFSSLGGHLPICVVDESIYKNPPTMLIGTVDKFAMLAWNGQSGNIFEVGGGPDLIIQDELHLISGPLGSMVGLYEGVIDYMSSSGGRRPKIIASTATIRRANEQCTALYDRPMAQFPPSGLEASDSFFAKQDDGRVPGRMYVGLLPTASSSALTAQIRSVVSLLQGAYLVVDPDGSASSDSLLDPYWTIVQYFGSLKELGRAATFVSADIPEFLPTMYRRYNLEPTKRRYLHTAEELTSRKNEDEIPTIIKRLEVRYSHGARWENQALDTVLATNMISVGVDIDRLGLMMIVTQPKGTSEYIQASSRVGRSSSALGFIITLYNASRPRDRSHYEQFKGYHESFYRYVEPTSVTPFSPPALDRALHAVVIIAGRHVAKWSGPGEIDAEHPEFNRFLRFLRERVESVDPEHLEDFDELLGNRIDEWQQRKPEKWGDLGPPSGETVLMRPSGSTLTSDDEFSWPTPTSMRNVDVECEAQIISRYPAGEEASP